VRFSSKEEVFSGKARRLSIEGGFSKEQWPGQSMEGERKKASQDRKRKGNGKKMMGPPYLFGGGEFQRFLLKKN